MESCGMPAQYKQEVGWKEWWVGGGGCDIRGQVGSGSGR